MSVGSLLFSQMQYFDQQSVLEKCLRKQIKVINMGKFLRSYHMTRKLYEGITAFGMRKGFTHKFPEGM